MKRVRVGMLIGGIILAFIALGLLAGGGWLIWAYSTERDAQGYYAFDPEPFGAPGYAITSENLQLGAPNEWFPEDLATVRISVSGDAETFLGIGPSKAVARYLRNVPHSVVSDVEDDPFRVTYQLVQGEAVPEPPADQTFWVARSTGSGGQTLTWDLGGGNYTVVLMNADVAQGIDVRLSAGVKVDLVLPIAIGALIVGLILAASAITLIVLSTSVGTPTSSGSRPERPDQTSTG